MQLRDRQRGITLMGFVVVLIVVGFFAYMGMRLFPMYTEYSSITKALDATVADPAINSADERKIRDMISRHFEIDYVESIDPAATTFPKGVVIKRTPNGITLSVNYDVSKPLFYNVSLVGHFEYTAPKTSQPQPQASGG